MQIPVGPLKLAEGVAQLLEDARAGAEPAAYDQSNTEVLNAMREAGLDPSDPVAANGLAWGVYLVWFVATEMRKEFGWPEEVDKLLLDAVMQSAHVVLETNVPR